ncbi:RIO1 family regulatory kinase/ATPase [Longispora sp. NPDC051575]|uniref:serine protein kinase RIO n=1 Tax=Longispora sp. NPDC051575 TaxID=3154943 RepID=UPI0034240EA2
MRDTFSSGGFINRTRGKNRFDADDIVYEKHYKADTEWDLSDASDGLPEGDRWSTWDSAAPLERGPLPHPSWVVTDLGAVDTELGILKTGKEGDVFLIRRSVPGTDTATLLAAKRYRSSEHKMFHRDAGYTEGRQVAESRMQRAVANRSEFGRKVIAGQWAMSEFNALRTCYQWGLPVPYPVQISDTEILMEFIGDADGAAAPRLANARPEGAELLSVWEQLVEALVTLAQRGFAHGDLSPYNLLVHQGRLVIIDLPQIVDVVVNPQGGEYLARDARNVGTWFAARGLTGGSVTPDDLPELLRREAGR